MELLGAPSSLVWIGSAWSNSSETSCPASDLVCARSAGRVDPRLVRFSAGATACTLAVVLLIMDVARPLGLGLLASQVAVFAFTAFVSFQWSLWAQIFARFIWPRIERTD